MRREREREDCRILILILINPLFYLFAEGTRPEAIGCSMVSTGSKSHGHFLNLIPSGHHCERVKILSLSHWCCHDRLCKDTSQIQEWIHSWLLYIQEPMIVIRISSYRNVRLLILSIAANSRERGAPKERFRESATPIFTGCDSRCFAARWGCKNKRVLMDDRQLFCALTLDVLLAQNTKLFKLKKI